MEERVYKLCPYTPGSASCLSWPCNGVMRCDGVDEFEMPMGVPIDQNHPLMVGDRVGPGRSRLRRLRVRNIEGCARCGQDHANLRFERLERPIDDCDYWAPCPTNKQPIILKVGD